MTRKSEAALVKRATTALAPYEEELAQEAKDEKAQGTLGVPRITHRSAQLVVDDKPVAGNKIKLAVVDFIFEKAYFAGEFNPNKPATPDCYAFGRPQSGGQPGDTEAKMVAHPQAPEKQNLQADGTSPCKGCKHNQWRTAKIGNGKRCKDIRRLLVISPRIGQDGKVVVDEAVTKKAALYQISVPPGSLGNFNDYYANLEGATRTGNIREMVVEVGTAPGKRGAHVLTFEQVAPVSSEGLQGILAIRKMRRDVLMAPYPVLGEPESKEPEVKRTAKQNKKLK